MFDFSPVQLLIVAIIALVVFGPKRLPELGRSLGHGLREFRGTMSGHDDKHDDPDLESLRPQMTKAEMPAAPAPAPVRTGATAER